MLARDRGSRDGQPTPEAGTRCCSRPDLRLQTSGLQSHERIDCCCFQLLVCGHLLQRPHETKRVQVPRWFNVPLGRCLDILHAFEQGPCVFICSGSCRLGSWLWAQISTGNNNTTLPQTCSAVSPGSTVSRRRRGPAVTCPSRPTQNAFTFFQAG